MVLARLDEYTRAQVVGGLLASTRTSVRLAGVRAADHLLREALSATATWEPLLRELTADANEAVRERARKSTSLRMQL